MNLLRWTKAEILHLAWKRGRYTPPDRKMLAERILPTIADDGTCTDVLFVGVQWYTTPYAAIFAKKRLATLDYAPELARYGASDHIVGDVCELPAHYGSRRFDAIVLNGVIGYGLNSPEAVGRALAACAAVMRPGGLLVIGVNEEKPTHIDPAEVAGYELFEPAAFGPWSERVVVDVPFRENTHTFLFWKKR